MVALPAGRGSATSSKGSTFMLHNRLSRGLLAGRAFRGNEF
jgi:hypothetical protein